jgi:hypothetical protein
MKKYIYWKNGDEVEDKLQRHLYAVTAYSLLNSMVKFYQCYFILGTLQEKFLVRILTGMSLPF